jgi:hypothetical protein
VLATTINPTNSRRLYGRKWICQGEYVYGNGGVVSVTNVVGGESEQFYRVAPVL